MKVRRATPADDAAIADLFAVYAKEFAHNLGAQDVVGEGRHAREYYGGNVFVADHGGRVLGCVAFEPWTPPRCRMKRMIVHPDGRGRGFGRMLAEAALQEATVAGYTEMCLDTTKPMVAATALYRSLGFEEFTADYEALCNDVFYLRRDLA